MNHTLLRPSLIGLSLAASLSLACGDDLSSEASAGSSETADDSGDGNATANSESGDAAGEGDGDGDGDGDGEGDGDGDGDGDGEGEGDGDGDICGDGVQNGPEACDDANLDSADGCLDNCTIPQSCQQLLEYDDMLDDGLYLIAPTGLEGGLFQVYCDMSTDGGGWAVIFKNHGGSVPGELSNDQLLDGDPGDYAGPITPHTLDLVSGVNPEAWAHYRGDPYHEWLKIGTLWDPQGLQLHEQTIRADLGAVTWDWILTLSSSEPCHLAPNPIALVANGDQLLGQTDRVSSYQANRQTFGLANDGHGVEDSCAQPLDNLISDPNAVLHRVDGGSTLNGVRHLFSYRHTAAGADASRCQFACWGPEISEYYDGFTWLVR